MKLHFLGANRQVTGSRYCLETKTSRLMVDCGLFQERQFTARNWHESTIPANSISAMVLTHGHIDHTGLVPKMVKHGMKSPIYATQPTVDLVEIMLKDSAKIQKEDADYKKKRHKKQGKSSRHPIEPLYNIKDVENTIKLLQGVDYHAATQVTDDISVTFHDAGHILGSAILGSARRRGRRETQGGVFRRHWPGWQTAHSRSRTHGQRRHFGHGIDVW